MANPEKLHADTYPNRKSPYESVAEQMAEETEALDAWFTGLLVWFGPVMEAFARISDPRNPKRIKHQRVVVLVFGVLLFLTQCTFRREGNRQLTEPKSWTTLQAAFPQWNSVPHMDTMANVLEQIPPSEVEAVLTGTIKRLGQSTQTTTVRNTLLGSVTVTHPFHPLRGQTFSVLKVRVVNQVRLYSLDTDLGVLSVPEAWTDRQPVSGLPSTPWSPEVIQACRLLVTMIRQSLPND